MKITTTLLILSLLALRPGKCSAQCAIPASAIADVTLQCSGGSGNRSGVAYYPTKNQYYSVNAGQSSYPIECFAVTGGNPVSAVQSADYRGFWYNPLLQQLEGNSVSSGGIFRHDITLTAGYPTGNSTYAAAGAMPDPQSCGAFNFTTNEVVYFFNMALHKYSRVTGAFNSSVAVTGMPPGNINGNSLGFTTINGAEICLYDYTNQRVNFINYSTGAYVSSCQLPASAPSAASLFRMSYANNRVFLYDNTTSRWLGYKVSAQADVVFAGNNLYCQPGPPTTITASGAASYLWLNTGSSSSVISVSPPTSTVYVLNFTSPLGCTKALDFILTVNPTPTITAIASPSFQCDAFSNTLTAFGASSYTWSVGPAFGSSVAVTTSGVNTYTVIGEDAFCLAFTTVTVINEASPQITAGASGTAICSGESVTLTAQGASNYTWSASPSTAGTVVIAPTVTSGYTVTGFSPNGCSNSSGTTTLSIVVKPAPSLSVTASASVICLGESLSMSASGAANYQWLPGNLTPPTISVAPIATTVYTLSGSNGTCTAKALLTITVSACTDITSNGERDEYMQIWPNPCVNGFYLRSAEACNCRLVNSTGEVVMSFRLEAGTTQFYNVQELPQGLYILESPNYQSKVLVLH